MRETETKTNPATHYHTTPHQSPNLLAEEEELAGEKVSFVVLKVEGDALVVFGGGVGADDVGVQLHLAV